MKKISGALARLAGVHADPVKPDKARPPDETLEPDYPARDDAEDRRTALDELDTLVAELERDVENG